MILAPTNRLAPLAPLSESALARSIAETMATAPEDGVLWLFAYGSLIWSPCFTPAETRRGVLPGYRRAFNMWTIRTRGTRDNPGLGLGLESGGACAGVLFRIAPETRDRDIDAIWAREMYTAMYRPCWLSVECDGDRLRALSFVTDLTHPQYAGEMPNEDAAEIIARAEGESGPCRDYLFDLLDGLAEYEISEPHFDVLAAKVRARGVA